MNLVDRVKRMRAGLPAKEEWNKLDRKSREERVLSLLDEDAQTFDNGLGYEAYIKACEIFVETTYSNEFPYQELMEIFDLAEKCAKYWVFA